MRTVKSSFPSLPQTSVLFTSSKPVSPFISGACWPRRHWARDREMEADRGRVMVRISIPLSVGVLCSRASGVWDWGWEMGWGGRAGRVRWEMEGERVRLSWREAAMDGEGEGTAWQLNPPRPVYWGARLIEQEHTNVQWQPGLRGGCPASIHGPAPALMHRHCGWVCVCVMAKTQRKMSKCVCVYVCVFTMVISVERVGLSFWAFEWFQCNGIVR